MTERHPSSDDTILVPTSCKQITAEERTKSKSSPCPQSPTSNTQGAAERSWRDSGEAAGWTRLPVPMDASGHCYAMALGVPALHSDSPLLLLGKTTPRLEATDTG
ncbi:uncharacterized protein LOC143988381 [Lithobates pipiens]